MTIHLLSGKQPGGAVAVVTEFFYGTGVAAQLVELAVVPILPIVVGVWNDQNQVWTEVTEGAAADYTIAEGTRQIQFAAGYTVPAAVAPSRNKNIRVRYYASAASLAAAGAGLDGVGAISLTGADPTENVDITVSGNTGRGKIKRIVVIRIATAGPAYNANSRDVEIFDVNTAGAPVSDNVNTLYLNVNNEPNAAGRLINVTTAVIGEIVFNNLTAGQVGVVSVRISADGGGVGSSEDYVIIIEGEELV